MSYSLPQRKSSDVVMTSVGVLMWVSLTNYVYIHITLKDVVTTTSDHNLWERLQERVK